VISPSTCTTEKQSSVVTLHRNHIKDVPCNVEAYINTLGKISIHHNEWQVILSDGTDVENCWIALIGGVLSGADEIMMKIREVLACNGYDLKLSPSDPLRFSYQSSNYYDSSYTYIVSDGYKWTPINYNMITGGFYDPQQSPCNSRFIGVPFSIWNGILYTTVALSHADRRKLKDSGLMVKFKSKKCTYSRIPMYRYFYLYDIIDNNTDAVVLDDEAKIAVALTDPKYAIHPLMRDDRDRDHNYWYRMYHDMVTIQALDEHFRCHGDMMLAKKDTQLASGDEPYLTARELMDACISLSQRTYGTNCVMIEPLYKFAIRLDKDIENDCRPAVEADIVALNEYKQTLVNIIEGDKDRKELQGLIDDIHTSTKYYQGIQ
jgi:hypothetical protein